MAISDSVIWMYAIISFAAAEEFKQRNRKRVTENTLGNLIQLCDADVVATHLGPRNKRIMMYIKAFKVVGCDNSPAIGIPRPIDCIPEIIKLQESLNVFRRKEGSMSRPGSMAGDSTQSSPLPQRQARGSLSDNSKESQQLFSQVPLQSRSPTSPNEKKKLVGLKLPPEALPKPSKPQIRTEALLAMIKARNPRKEQNVETEVPLHQLTPKEEDILVEKISARSEVSDPSATLESHPANFGASTFKMIGDSQKSNSPRDETPANSTGRNSSRTGSKRQKIRTRDIRIPKDQQDLLNREDSWLPAEPGNRGPVANVPILNLQAISRQVERQTRKPAAPDGKSPQPESFREETSVLEPVQQASEAGTSIASSDWPPSSPLERPQDQLPPDSSVVSPLSGDWPQSAEKRHGGRSSPHQTANTKSAVDTDKIRRSRSLESQPSSQRRASSAYTNSPNIQAPDNPSMYKNTESQKQEREVINLDSDSEPELETSVPLQLVERKEESSSQDVPFTAVQPQKSILQVKRTPYVKGDKRNSFREEIEDHPPPGRYMSPSKRRRLDISNVNEVEGSLDSPRTTTQNSWSLDDGGPRSGTAPDGPTEIQCSVTEGTEAAGPCQPIPPGVFLPQEEVNVKGNPSAFPTLSPNVSKRQKKKKFLFDSKFTQDQQIMEDPSVMARRYRREFLASRNNSLSGNPILDVKQEVPSISRSVDNLIYSGSCTDTQSKNAGGELCASINQTLEARKNDKPSPSRDLDEPASDVSEVSFETSRRGQFVGDVDIPRAMPSDTTSSTAMPELPIVPSIEKSESLLYQTASSDIQAVARISENVSSVSNQHSRGDSKQNGDSQQSGLAQSLPSLMTPALSVIDMGPQVTSDNDPDFSPSCCSSLAPDSIFRHFRKTYPSYTGNFQHFAAICKRIKDLIRVDRMEHKSLWDDFIVRHKMDYPHYLQRCAEAVEEHKQYEQFYRDEIEEPIYTKRVVTPQILGAMLSLDQSDVEPERRQSEAKSFETEPSWGNVSVAADQNPKSGFSSVGTGKSPLELPAPSNKPANNGLEIENVAFDVPSLTTSEGPSTVGNRKPPNSFQAIDLTTDDDGYLLPRTSPQYAERAGSPTLSPKLSSRTPPWVENSTRLSYKHESSTIADNTFKRRLPKAREHTKDLLRMANSDTSQASPTGVQLSKLSKSEPERAGLPAPQERSRDKNNLPNPARQPISDSRQGQKTDVPPSNSKTPLRVRAKEESDEWWKDDSTPFAQFARAYASIQPGKGNSFAKAEPGEKQKNSVRNQEEQPERIDVMAWHL